MWDSSKSWLTKHQPISKTQWWLSSLLTEGGAVPRSHTCNGVNGEEWRHVSWDEFISHRSVRPRIPVTGEDVENLSAWWGLATDACHIGRWIKDGVIIIHILHFHPDKSLSTKTTLWDEQWAVITIGLLWKPESRIIAIPKQTLK